MSFVIKWLGLVHRYALYETVNSLSLVHNLALVEDPTDHPWFSWSEAHFGAPSSEEGADNG